MAMTQRSTRGYGKGFGDMMPEGTLNCPGDPGCPGYVDPSVNEAILNAIAQAQQANATFSAPSSSWTQLAQNYSMVIYAGAAAAVLLLLFGGKR